VRGKGTKIGEEEGSKLGEPCSKVRLSQDRLPILHTNVIHANIASSKCHSTDMNWDLGSSDMRQKVPISKRYHLKVKSEIFKTWLKRASIMLK
jgi:hypothetical protein